MNDSLCIFGFGYTAHYLAEVFLNSHFSVIGVTRNPDKKSADIHPHCPRIHFSKKALAEYGICPTHILISTPPSEMGDPTLNEFCSYLTQISPTLQAIVYLSSTGVYGDHKGQWVDESSKPLNPSNKAEWRLIAEKSWLHLSDKIGVPLYIFRVASIYGPFRNALHRIKNGQQVSIFKVNQFFSRIHVEDLVSMIKSALLQPEYAGIYNICDNEPASNTAVDDFAAHLLGMDPLPHQPYEQANLSAMAREFYQANKKVCNLKILNIPGIKLAYPDYRVGLTSLFTHGKY